MAKLSFKSKGEMKTFPRQIKAGGVCDNVPCSTARDSQGVQHSKMEGH